MFKLDAGVRAGILVLLCSIIGSAACEDQPTALDDSQGKSNEPNVQFAIGGIPGPPVDIVIPRHIGPPRHVLVRLPVRAGPPAFLSSIIAIGSGLDHTCALQSDGAAFCWGGDDVGQLGDGTTLASASPVQVNSSVAFTRLYVGDEIACGVDATNQAHCWGGNQRGQLGAGIASGTPSLVPVPIDQPRFTEMNLGLRASCGMGTDGIAYCWGSNSFGELGVPAGPDSNVPVPVTNSLAVGLFTVDNGFFHSCGLGSGNQVFCWGSDAGRFGNGTTAGITSAVPVPAASGLRFNSLSVASGYTCGLDAAGSAHCWGRNNSGEVGNGSFASVVPAPAAVTGGLSFVSIYTDGTNRSFKDTCGLTSAGAAWCWGANDFGQLGAASNEICTLNRPCSTEPVAVSGGHQFSQIAIGGDHTCALSRTGAVYCWGANYVGQLGNGTLTNRSTPGFVLF